MSLARGEPYYYTDPSGRRRLQYDKKQRVITKGPSEDEPELVVRFEHGDPDSRHMSESTVLETYMPNDRPGRIQIILTESEAASTSIYLTIDEARQIATALLAACPT